MPNTSPTTEEFRRSLDQLVAQAQQTAQLGLAVAREQVETLVQNPNVNDQFEEVRKNLQNMAKDMETKAQELVHLASTYVAQAPGGIPNIPNPFATQAPRTGAPQTEVKVEQPSGNESHTGSGAGTAQTGSNMNEPTPTPNGEAPQQ